MKHRSKFQAYFIATVISLLALNTVHFQLSPNHLGTWLSFTGSEAQAKKSSGGRSGGGSFSRPSSSGSSSSSPSRSSGSSSSSPSRSSGSSGSSRSTSPSTSSGSRTGGISGGGSFQRPATPAPAPTVRSQPAPVPPPVYRTQPVPRSGGSTVIVVPDRTYNPPYQTNPNLPTNPSATQTNPVPAQPGSPNTSVSTARSSSNNFFRFLLFLIVAGGLIFLAYLILNRKKDPSPQQELDNDIVTVSKLQVALLAQARTIQSHLTEISANADTETSEGLTHLLQESALALLRSPEYWTHVSSSSQTVRSREEAGALFNQISIAERSKFSAETFSHVNGSLRRHQPTAANPDAGLAEYIVVTLLLGTADDKPLFGEIRTPEEMKAALQKAAAIPSNYLMVFELLWSPQSETDTLTYDDLLMGYSDMVQIA